MKYSSRRAALLLAFVLPAILWAQPAVEPMPPPAVIPIVEDDSEAFIRQLNNDGSGDGSQIRQEFRDVYSGVSSIRVTPMQRFSSRIQGWNHPIVENPQAGQYRYLRFAWKRIEGAGIMIQMHAANGSWNQRYYAGFRSDQTAGWGAMIQVDPKAPAEWTVVTRDLFKDFGGFTMTGFALTSLDPGGAGLFDHILLGRSMDELDRASAEAFGKTPRKDALNPIQLGQLWNDLGKGDQKAAGSAMRTLAAGHKESVPYLAKALQLKSAAGDTKQVMRWIQELDDDSFTIREAAHRALDQLGDASIRSLQAARARPTSEEQRCRIEALLKNRGVTEGDLTNEQLRMIRAARVLEWAGTAEALQALDTAAKAPPDPSVAVDLRLARERLAKAMKR